MENKCSILTLSHLHQSIENLSRFCFKLTEFTVIVCMSLLLDVTSFENGCNTRKRICMFCSCQRNCQQQLCSSHLAHNFMCNHPADTRHPNRKGTFAKTSSPGWPSVSDATMDCSQACFQSSPQRLIS